MKENKKYIAVLIAIILIFVGKSAYNAYQVKTIYEDAINLIAKECYSDASEKLYSIAKEQYRDTEELIRYCEANIAYANGDIQNAYWFSYSLSFRYQTFEQMEKIDSFIHTVEKEYDAYLTQKWEEKQKAYEEKVTSGVPFVGMAEKDIGRTTLGEPDPKIRHNKEVMNGEQYTANLYDFYKDSGKVFSARCIQGEVTQVWDYRENPIFPSVEKPTSNNVKEDADPYNASDYSDPEDFYYDYYDDFWDFEDAEDYWNEHSSSP